MQYKIIFDPQSRMLKAIAISTQKGAKKTPAVELQKNQAKEVTEDEAKKMNGGKMPNFPKMMPPSGSVWGAMKDPTHKRVVILVPKPITELGVKNGRITGRDSKGDPIYGGYYQISLLTPGGALPSQEDFKKLVLKSDAMKDIRAEYQKHNLEVLSMTPSLVNIKTGEMVNFEPKPVKQVKTVVKVKTKGTTFKSRYPQVKAALKDFPAKDALNWVYTIDGKNYKFELGDSSTLMRFRELTNRESSELKRLTGQKEIEGDWSHEDPFAVWSFLVLGAPMDRSVRPETPIDKIKLNPDLWSFLKELGTTLYFDTDGKNGGSIITGHEFNQVEASVGIKNNVEDVILHSHLDDHIWRDFVANLSTLKAPLKQREKRMQKRYPRIHQVAVDLVSGARTSCLEDLMKDKSFVTTDRNLSIAYRLNKRGLYLGNPEHIKKTSFKGVMSLTTNDIRMKDGKMIINFSLFHANTPATLSLDPKNIHDYELIQDLKEQLSLVENSDSTSNRLFPDLDKKRYTRFINKVWQNNYGKNFNKLMDNPDTMEQRTVADLPINAMDIARAGRAVEAKQYLESVAQNLRMHDDKLKPSAVLTKIAIHFQDKYGAGSEDGFKNGFPSQTKKEFKDLAKTLGIIKGVLEIDLKKALGNKVQDNTQAYINLVKYMSDETYENIDQFPMSTEFALENGFDLSDAELDVTD